MRVLLTGANGYIGKRLLPVLVRMGHYVICCVRDKNRFTLGEEFDENINEIITRLEGEKLLKAQKTLAFAKSYKS